MTVIDFLHFAGDMPQFTWRSSLNGAFNETDLVLHIRLESRSLRHSALLRKHAPIEGLSRSEGHPCLFLGDLLVRYVNGGFIRIDLLVPNLLNCRVQVLLDHAPALRSPGVLVMN